MDKKFNFSTDKAREWCDRIGVPYDTVTEVVMFCDTGVGALRGDAIRFLVEAVRAWQRGEDCGSGITIDWAMQAQLLPSP